MAIMMFVIILRDSATVCKHNTGIHRQKDYIPHNSLMSIIYAIPVAVLPLPTVSKVSSIAEVRVAPIHSTITITLPASSFTVYVVGDS